MKRWFAFHRDLGLQLLALYLLLIVPLCHPTRRRTIRSSTKSLAGLQTDQILAHMEAGSLKLSPEKFDLQANPLRFESILRNLIENPVKYAGKDAQIKEFAK